MTWLFPKRILIPAFCYLVALEILLGLGLALWIIGWPISDRFGTKNDDPFYSNTTTSNLSLFYYITVIALTGALMLFLLGALIPESRISRWMMIFAIIAGLWSLAILTNALLLTGRVIGIGSCDNYDDDDGDRCTGDKIVWSSTVVLMGAIPLAIGFAIWMISAILFGAIRKVLKRSKYGDKKLSKSARHHDRGGGVFMGKPWKKTETTTYPRSDVGTGSV